MKLSFISKDLLGIMFQSRKNRILLTGYIYEVVIYLLLELKSIMFKYMTEKNK